VITKSGRGSQRVDLGAKHCRRPSACAQFGLHVGIGEMNKRERLGLARGGKAHQAEWR